MQKFIKTRGVESVKIADIETPASQKLISRKFCMAGKIAKFPHCDMPFFCRPPRHPHRDLLNLDPQYQQPRITRPNYVVKGYWGHILRLLLVQITLVHPFVLLVVQPIWSSSNSCDKIASIWTWSLKYSLWLLLWPLHRRRKLWSKILWQVLINLSNTGCLELFPWMMIPLRPTRLRPPPAAPTTIADL